MLVEYALNQLAFRPSHVYFVAVWPSTSELQSVLLPNCCVSFSRRSQLPLVSTAARSRAQVRTLSALRPLPDVAKRSMGLSVYDYGNDMGSTMDALSADAACDYFRRVPRVQSGMQRSKSIDFRSLASIQSRLHYRASLTLCVSVRMCACVRIRLNR